MTLQQFLLILWERRKLVIGTFLATVLTALIVSLLLPKQYTAATAVVIDVKSPDPIAGMVLPGMMAPGYMATQVDIINSDRVAQRVVKLLKMDESPVIQEQWRDATEGRGQIHAWLATLLQKPHAQRAGGELGFGPSSGRRHHRQANHTAPQVTRHRSDRSPPPAPVISPDTLTSRAR